MFQLEEILALFTNDCLIRLVDEEEQPLFTASCPAIIPGKYRNMLVKSIQHGYGHVTIKLYTNTRSVMI